MARKRRPSLVAEIARLLVEYPEKEWRVLVDNLRDHSLINDIASAIEDLISMTVKSTGKKNTVRNRPRESVIARVAREDTAKADILSSVQSRLANKDNVVPLAYIREFASSLGMKEELPARREQAVNQIIEYLSSKTTDEIEAALLTVLPMQDQGQEFERWVDLILGKDASTARKRSSGEND